MPKLKSTLVYKSIQFRTLLLLVLVFISLVGLLSYSNKFIFERFLGSVTPWVFAVVISILGIAAFALLLIDKGFVVYKKKEGMAFLWVALPVLLFVSIAVLVDWQIVYPADMNIPYPESLLFYPAMGFLVEVLFHLLPLAVLLFLFNAIFKTTANPALVWVVMVIVALLEPTYQVIMDPYPNWALITVWVNLFLFNMLQLWAFRQYDFVSMFALRLFYYLFWHIIWGSLRLDLLF
ncbi:MAG: hypothetical protein WBM77_03850 [Maribacter sp.]